MMHLTDAEFETLLSKRFPDWYGTVKMVGRRACYPLGLVHADRYIAHQGGGGIVLVADAAHGIHPIAGQGLNLGFRDLDELSSLVNAAHANGEDIAALELLETYQRRRRPDNMAMVAMTDGLNRLFSNNLKSVRLLRRTGLKLVSRLKPAKDFFMRQAMGDK
jgi:2-octaprenyl-6-methoxyphenol hydroxylase